MACHKSPSGKHQWQAFALGRICSACQLTQATGEFTDDDAPGKPPSDSGASDTAASRSS